MSTHTALEAASLDRKARLAQLKNLKRKQPEPSPHSEEEEQQQPAKRPSRSPSPSKTDKYLSGRNYDAETRGPKLGFDTAPSTTELTLEERAKELADRTRAEREAEEKEDKPLDLSKIQPKRPNWDLKRDLKKKMEVLDRRTDNAIARLARERIEKLAKEQRERENASANGGTNGVEGGEAIGINGNELVEATRELEREDEVEKRREEEDDFA